MNEIPDIPTKVSYTQHIHADPRGAGIPAWVGALIGKVNRGEDSTQVHCDINGISLSKEGDLVLYRRVLDKDRRTFPVLDGVEEVWFGFDIPTD